MSLPCVGRAVEYNTALREYIAAAFRLFNLPASRRLEPRHHIAGLSMKQINQNTVSITQPADDYSTGGPLLSPITADEQYVLNSFRLLSKARQEAVKVVLGSMIVGD